MRRLPSWRYRTKLLAKPLSIISARRDNGAEARCRVAHVCPAAKMNSMFIMTLTGRVNIDARYTHNQLRACKPSFLPKHC